MEFLTRVFEIAATAMIMGYALFLIGVFIIGAIGDWRK